MAETPRDFEIKIKCDASSAMSGLTATSRELIQTGKAAEQAAGGLKESAAAADKAFVAKKDLKGMVKGLKEEFPELSHYAKLALNPITLVVASITAGWKIWTTRVKELTESLSQVELPDTKALDPGHIDAMTVAWMKWAEAVDASSEKLNSVEQGAKRVFEAIDAAAARQKQLVDAQKALAEARGEDVSGFAGKGRELEFGKRQQKIDAKLGAAADLDWDAKKKEKEAASIKVGSAEDDKQTSEALKGRAEAGKKEMDEALKRMTELRAYQGGEMGFFQRKAYEAKYAMQYGTMSTDEARGLMQQQYDSGALQVNRYNDWQKGMPARDFARKRRDSLLGDAAHERGAAEGLFYEESPFEQEQLNLDRGTAKKTGLMDQLTGAEKALKEGEMEATRLGKAAASQVEHTGRASQLMLQAMEKQAQINDALMAKIARLESQLANSRNR